MQRDWGGVSQVDVSQVEMCRRKVECKHESERVPERGTVDGGEGVGRVGEVSWCLASCLALVHQG